MKIAFLNLCNTDPPLVARAAGKLTRHPDLDMYVHVDLKSNIEPFEEALSCIPKTHLIDDRVKVYWGGFNAIKATVALLRAALASPVGYDYFATLQNLDYPIRSNDDIVGFFASRDGTEFIRGCPISRTRDWHYSRIYKTYNRRDDDFYLKKHSKPAMAAHYLHMLVMSAATIWNNGIIVDGDGSYSLYYGAAQWAVTRACASHIVRFYDEHPRFNSVMQHIRLPDEEYFHTIVHNSPYKTRCSAYNEPERRWLVNWRNLHYFEFPREVSLLTERDYDNIMLQDALFIRKVRTGISDTLLDKIDKITD